LNLYYNIIFIESDNISNISSVYSTENQENNGVEIPTVYSVFRESEDSHAHVRLTTYLKIDFYDKVYFINYLYYFIMF